MGRILLKTHCPKGHPLSGDALYARNDGGRECRTCRRVRGLRKRIARKTKSMSEATAQLVLEALRKGKTLTSICSGRLNNCYTPGEKITDHSLYRNYCAAHPDFSREAQALLAENTRAATARKGARLRNRTHCKYWHPLSGECCNQLGCSCLGWSDRDLFGTKPCYPRSGSQGPRGQVTDSRQREPDLTIFYFRQPDGSRRRVFLVGVNANNTDRAAPIPMLSRSGMAGGHNQSSTPF